MKTPRFWYPQQSSETSTLGMILSPLSYLFTAASWVRRMSAHPYRSRVPVVCVGNAVAGGAGKTPTALTLSRILKERGQKPVFVTRGYGGHGELVCVDPLQHEAQDVGDESLLLAAQAPTWAGRDRAAAIRQAESYGTVVIMDDGFQNPHVKPTASILVVDGVSGLGNGRIVPAGPLRETFAAALSRATAVVLIGEDRHNLIAQIKAPVFRARLMPRLPPGFSKQGKFVAFAGIARPAKFYATARELGLDLATTCDFADHHVYTESDIDTLRLTAEERGARLLTTEKDAMRLSAGFRSEVVVLPVGLVFDEPQAEGDIAQLCISSCAL